MTLSTFSHVYWPSVGPLWRSVYSGPLLIFDWIFWWHWLINSFMNSLLIVDINLLSDILLVNMFSHLVGCLFILLIVSFAVQKLISLVSSHLFNFSFVSLAWGDISEKILLWEMSEILLPVFSSRIFMILSLTFKSLIHFEIILGYGVRRWSSLIFFAHIQFS